MHLLFGQSELRDLIERVEKGERLNLEAGVRMLNSQDILAIGYMANLVRERINGNKTYFIVNKPITYINGCSDLTDSANAAMCYGRNESPEELIDRLLQLRKLQDQTGEFLTFAPVPFYPEHINIEGTMGVETTTGIEDLKMLAVSRIILDNFDHIKGFWAMLGLKLAQVSLAFGVDDLDGTVMEKDTAHSSGVETSQVIGKQALIQMIQKAGREAVERKG